MTIRKAASYFASASTSRDPAIQAIAMGLQELAKSLAREIEHLQRDIKQIETRIR